jgi:hypothetical protein
LTLPYKIEILMLTSPSSLSLLSQKKEGKEKERKELGSSHVGGKRWLNAKRTDFRY